MAASARIDELRKKFDENPRRYFAPLANEYRKAGDLQQAIAICQEFLPQQQGHMSGHIVYGQALYESQRHEEARAVFETALALDPENLIALRHLGEIARALGDSAAARSWYQRVLEADPRNEEIAALLQGLLADQPGTMAIEPEPEPATGAPTELNFISDADFSDSDAPLAPAIGQPDAPPPEPVLDFAPPPEPEPLPVDALEMVADLAAPGEPQPEAAGAVEIIADFSAPAEPHAHEPGLDIMVDFAPVEPEPSPAMDIGLEPTSFAGAEPSDQEVQPLPSLEVEPTSLDATMPSIELDSMVPGTEASPPAPELAMPAELTAEGGPDMLDLDIPAMDPAGAVPDPEPVELEPVALDFNVDPVSVPEAPSDTGAATPDLLFIEPDPELEPAPQTEPALDVPAPEPESVAAAAPPAPEQAFVTETMAELYLSQGHVREAVGVYRQLLETKPGDEDLRHKLASAEMALEAPPAAAADASPVEGASPAHRPDEAETGPSEEGIDAAGSGPTIREFLAGIAAGGS